MFKSMILIKIQFESRLPYIDIIAYHCITEGFYGSHCKINHNILTTKETIPSGNDSPGTN